MRAVPAGTVGGRMAIAQIPLFLSFSAKVRAREDSPKKERNNWRLGLSNLQIGSPQVFSELLGKLKNLTRSPGLLFQDVECTTGGRGGRSRESGGVNVRSAPIDQPVAKIARAGDEPPDPSEGLAECSHPDGNAILHPKPFAYSSAVGAENPGRMRLVDVKHRIETFGQVCQFLERGDISLHAKDRVGNDETSTKPAGFVKGPLERFGLSAIEETDGGFGETAPINETGMISPIRKDNVGRAGQGADRSEICCKTAWEDDGRLRSLKGRNSLFQTCVPCRVTADERRRAGSPPNLLDCFPSGLCDTGITR